MDPAVKNIAHMFVTIPCIVTALCFCADGQLSPSFYSNTCTNLTSIVGHETRAAITKNWRVAAGLLRMHFRDCFVRGCDASVLLNDTTNIMEVIDNIKAKVESACKGVVSCADILALAARDSVVETGGPSWIVPLGRRDSKTADQSAAKNQVPSSTSSLQTLIRMFEAKGLTATDMTALSGCHTIGYARCATFRGRIYNDTNVNRDFALKLQATCSPDSGRGDDNLAYLDATSPGVFDNAYYKNLKSKKGLLHSDQVLFDNGSQDWLVNTYIKHKRRFFNDFAAAMVKMGSISPLTGTNGEIRTNCRKVN